MPSIPSDDSINSKLAEQDFDRTNSFQGEMRKTRVAKCFGNGNVQSTVYFVGQEYPF
jgi:hypothetical protein